jgi:nitric oxide reductase activation protein
VAASRVSCKTVLSGEQPNPRITMRNVLNTRDLSVVVLLDLSESTNETMEGNRALLQLFWCQNEGVVGRFRQCRQVRRR